MFDDMAPSIEDENVRESLVTVRRGQLDGWMAGVCIMRSDKYSYVYSRTFT